MASAKVIETKKQLVQELSEKLKSAGVVIFADYRGLTVEEDTKLRCELREAGIEYKVIKNNIAKHAMLLNGIKGLDEYLKGPTAMAIGIDDPVAPAKILAKYAKSIKVYDIKAGMLDGKVVSINEINDLAMLPSKEELIAMVLGALNGPITGFVHVLNANLTGLVVALKAVVEKKEQEG